MNGLETAERRTPRSLRYGVAAIALSVGFAAMPAHGVAWADPDASTPSSTSSGTTTSSTTTSSTTGHTDKPTSTEKPTKDDAPSRAAERPDEPAQTETSGSGPDPDTTETDTDTADSATGTTDSGEPAAEPLVDVIDQPEPEQPAGSTPGEPATPVAAVDETAAAAEPDRAAKVRGSVATLAPPAGVLTLEVPGAQPDLVGPRTATEAAASASALVAVTGSTSVDVITPTAPQPLSPFAELLQLPGRLINAVLQLLDLTASADSPKSPLSFAPINDLLFAAFREFERLVGLDRTPAPPPVVPTLTYTGPTTTPTPTVAQFLNAAAAGYVLGGTPGGLVPFTVNGFQMSATNVLSGMVGKAWVTPQGQIIIAYQGTTGGSHLLFNPLVAISQVLVDIQIIFTRTTPWAFRDALHFANWVQAEAALQGYTSDDIFVTGHSLGGWEAQYVAQQIGLSGIGFEAPGINTTVPGNGADSMFVTVGTYGSSAPFMSSDLPGLQPFMPAYVPGGGTKPHYGPMVLIGDPAAMTPLYNASALWGKSLIGSIIFLVDFLGNFFQYHLPGVQAYHLDVTPDPGMVTWMGTSRGPVHTGYGSLTIPELMKAASDDGILFRP